MKLSQILCGSALLLLLALAGCGDARLGDVVRFGPDPGDLAKKRVEAVLTGIRDGGHQTGIAIQTSICRWERDVPLIKDRDELSAASDAFDRWRQAGGIYPSLGSFEIAEEVEGPGPSDPDDTYYVQVTVDGTRHWIRVPPEARMSWAD